MDRILLGNNAIGGTDDSKSGIWVSKPGSNVLAYAGNGYYAGTDPGPDGLQEDGSVLPIYGYNENFNFTGSNTHVFGFVPRRDDTQSGKIYSTSNGTIRFVCNTSTISNFTFFTKTLTSNTDWVQDDSYLDLNTSLNTTEQTFNGNNYPILEIKIRRPKRESDDKHWKYADFSTAVGGGEVYQWFFSTANSTLHGGSGENDEPLTTAKPISWLGEPSKTYLTSGDWESILGTSGQWITIEYDFENEEVRYQREDQTEVTTLTGRFGNDAKAHWVANTNITSLRFDPTKNLHTKPDPDLEIDYIRAKKRGIPINFGNSVDDNFTFSSDWFDTGLVHQTGVVTIGNEFAYANGAAKASGTSHPGSQSGRVDFPKLPYVPVVLFQRYDDRNTDTKVSFPGGDKEFSVAHGDLSYDSQVWNPLTRQYQKSSNSSYASEYRTFAYSRSGYDHFDLSCRNAIARDGYEWLFNYTPQEPYIEIYKGGNYEPETENPESFVMYPQVQHMMEETRMPHDSSTELLRYYKHTRSPYMGIDFPVIGRSLEKGLSTTKYYITPSFNNTRTGEKQYEVGSGFSINSSFNPQYHGFGMESETLEMGHSDYLVAGHYSPTSHHLTLAHGEYVDSMPQFIASHVDGTDGIYVPAYGSFTDFSVTPVDYLGSFLLYQGVTTGTISDTDITNWPSYQKGPNPAVPGTIPNMHKHLGGTWQDNITNNADQILIDDLQFQYENLFYDAGWFHDDASSGAAHAVGAMKPGVLGIRRGNIITTDNIPTEGWDQNEGRGAPWPPVINASAFSASGTIGALHPDFLGNDKALDYSARDYTTGKLGYFANYTGTDKGNCLPTFDWANKFGDWNVPQFNNFYQYDPDIGAGSYTSFKDAIGTSWTEKNTRFLDDSMWLGYANNRFEYKGDIWHPQAPTKTYDELSGVFGFGGMIKNQGDWAHGAGFGFLYGDDFNHNARHPYYYDIWPQEGMTGIHAISRYDYTPDSNLLQQEGGGGSGWNRNFGGNYNPERQYQGNPFHPHMQFRNRYGYAPGNMYDEWQATAQYNQSLTYQGTLRSNYDTRQGGGASPGQGTPFVDFYSGGQFYYNYASNDGSGDPIFAYNNIASKDFSSEIGFCGPGGAFLWSAPHDYGRMGAVSTSFTVERTKSSYTGSRSGDFIDNYTADLNIQRIMPPSIFWKRPAEWGVRDRGTGLLSGNRENPHFPKAEWGLAYADSMGLFYNNFTTPWDGLRLDDKRRNSSRLGFGGGPDTKQNYKHSDLYGTVLDKLDQNSYVDPAFTSGITTDMAIYGRYPFNAHYYQPTLSPAGSQSPYEGPQPEFGGSSRYQQGSYGNHDLLTFDKDPSWTEPQTGYNGHKDSFVVSRWYTYPGATFSYDVSNFSGPSHYDAWYKNDQTEEVQDYKRRDYPQLYEGGWGNYGYFPTQEQLDQGKGATRLFPDPHITSGGDSLVRTTSYDKDYYVFEFTDDASGVSSNFSIIGGYGSHPYNAPSPNGHGLGQYGDGAGYGDGIGKYNESMAGGPNMIFKKTAIIAVDSAEGSGFPLNKYFETPLVDSGGEEASRRWPIRAYFAPNHKHLDKHVSRTFGIPNEVAGDYYAASRRHNERYGHPDALPGNYEATQTSDVARRDTFLGMVGTEIGNDSTHPDRWKIASSFSYTHLHEYEYKIHSKEGFNTVFVGETRSQPPFEIGVGGKYHTYYHPDFVGGSQERKNLENKIAANRSEKPIQVLTDTEWNAITDKTQFPYADEKLRAYLYRKGVDLDNLEPGEAIPIKADPYFAGMAFEGTNSMTGAFNAHRFEFIIKKTKKHINHFRQSYEYNYPGRFPHRADTLRPIGYGLVTNHYGFDDFTSPPPAAHSYFDGRQLGGGHPFLKSKRDAYVKEYEDYFTGLDGDYWQIYHDSGVISNEWINYSSDREIYSPYSKYGFHPVNSVLANSWFGATSTWKHRIWRSGESQTVLNNQVDSDEAGWSSYETAYDREVITDPSISANGARQTLARTNFIRQTKQQAYEHLGYDPLNSTEASHTGSAQYLRGTSTSISRHGRDAIVDGIIGAVKVANTYSADYKATYWNGSSYVNWITSGADDDYDTATPKNTYYALNHKTLRYRPAKSQGASPETQMYSAYFGAPYNRWSDSTPFFAGLNSAYNSTGNYWEGDILPGMCKADNALTNWGTVDLSKFDESHIGYKWHNDAWFDNDRSGLARSIIWSPSNANTFFSEGDGAGRKGRGRDYFGYHEDRTQTNSYSERWNKYRITAHQKGGTYDGFKLHERPEFQPVSGDGRYFGGVGGVDNWGGTSYNTWGPGMCVSPAVWDLKWTGIQHPFNVSPSAEEDSNTFYNATSIENQTSYIGGAPNVRVLLGDNGGTFKYSNGTEVSGTGYDDANTWSATPMNYDWAIGGPQIQSNHWDRTLKIKDLEYLDRATEKTVQHANNGIQYPVSLKVRALYGQSVDDDGDGDNDAGHYWFLENNGNIKTRDDLGWIENDEIVLLNGSFETQSVRITGYTTGDGSHPGHFVDGTRVYHNADPDRTNIFGEVGVRTTQLLRLGGSTAGTVEGTSPATIDNFPQLIAYNKTLAGNPSRQPAGAFKANTTYHFQYMYDETKINPPKYKYWVLRIPAGVDAYNGESLL